MLGTSLKLAFYHPNPDLQTPWNCLQIGLLIFPLSPFLGAVSIGFAVLFTWLRRNRTIISLPLNRGFALLSVLLMISAGFAYGKTEAFLGLFNLYPFFLVFIGLSALIQTITQLRHIAWILVISSMPLTIMGFGQMFWGWAWKLQFLWIVFDWAIAPGGDPPGRMAANFMHANIFAAHVAIIFTLALGLWLEQWRSHGYQLLDIKYWRSNIKKIRKKFSNSPIPNPQSPVPSPQSPVPSPQSPVPSPQSPIPSPQSPVPSPQSPIPLLFLTVAVIANFSALILTNSRNGWAIAVVACLGYALYQGWRILVSGVVGVVATVFLAAFAPLPIAQIFRQVVPAFFWARLNDEMYPDRPIALMRKTQWEFAWSLTQQHPWTGWGLRNFTALYKAQMQIDLGHPHNLFLMLSAETGLPITLLFFSLLGWVLFAGIQLLRKSNHIAPEDRLIFFSYLVVFVEWLLFNTVDITLFDFRVNTLSWVLLSAICGVVYHYQHHKKLISEQS